MNKIKQIKLKHFKFFYGEVNIDLSEHNALIFGENEAAKSSLYWALYIFCKAFLRQIQQFTEIFQPSPCSRTLETASLLDGDESYIKLVFEDDQHSITEKTISMILPLIPKQET